MIFGIYGATRADELTKVDVRDVTEQENLFVVKIPETKNNVIRSFTIENEYAEYVRQYRNLRPSRMSTTRFFIKYQKGKCCNQVIGRHKFLSIPKKIAEFLNLPEPEKYTGHSFRRTSATLLADAGADIITLKRHGGWRSANIAEGYVQESINNKRKIGDLISRQIKLPRIEKPVATCTTTTTTDSLLYTDTEPVNISAVCTQSIVNIVHSEQEGGNVKLTNVGLLPNNSVVHSSTKPEDFQGMQFNNCSVNIHFHK